MKNTERQKLLDKEKWLYSEEIKCDCTGYMAYCEYCDYQADLGGCLACQTEREEKSLCARAFNRQHR